MTTQNAWSADQARTIIEDCLHLDGALIPALHALQEHFDHVPGDAVPLLADALNLSKAEVQGVISFYHDFRAEPAKRQKVQVCMAESCRVTGALKVRDHIAALPNVDVEEVFCLGNCALSPAAMVNGELLGRLDQGDIPARLQEAQS